MKRRTIFWGAIDHGARMVMGSCLTYGTGYNAGPTHGQSNSRVIPYLNSSA